MNINDYIATWKEIIQTPSDFYKNMPTTGGYADPITFAAISYVIYGLLTALIRHLFFNIWGFNFSVLVGTIIMIPIAGIVSLFIWGAILYVIYRALGGTGTYEGTVRFIVYASAPVALSWIPLLGLIAGIYGLYLNIIGGMNVHKVSIQKSVIAVILPFVIAILVGILIGILIVGVNILSSLLN